MPDEKKKTIKKRVLNHLGRVSLALVSAILMSTPAAASTPVAAPDSEIVGQALGTEGGQRAAKEALDAALKMARSKPAMTTATGIVCLACVPMAGVAASPGMCIACGILIAKTFG